MSGQLTPDFVVLPSGPRPGESQEELLGDFMQAVRGPQNDYAVARSFLTAGFAQTWNPDARAVVRASTATTSLSVGGASATYTFTSRAYVDADGRYYEQPLATQSLDFSFQLENGEWRISAAADGIVLSELSFSAAFTQTSLYFFDPNYAYLVPDVRWFPSRATAPVRIVRALLNGPASWLQQVVLSSFPVATALGTNTVRVDSGTATVDLSKEAIAANPQQRALMKQQLVATLGTPNVVLTVGGLELTAPSEGGSSALVDPSVESAVLAGGSGQFGFATESGFTPIAGISDPILALKVGAVSLSNDKQTAAVLGADGSVYAVRVGDTSPVEVDDRPGLIAPSLDPLGFVWSAQGASASSLTAFDLNATAHAIQTGLPADARIIAMKVSRDGTRVLLYLATSGGPQLLVAGVIRQNNIPARLGEPLSLPVPDGAPIDATWVDDHTVAALSGTDSPSVTLLQLGGPTTSFGPVPHAIQIVGGNATDGIRVLTSDGQIERPQGTGGWVSTGITASYLGTKQ
jgi:hypothetical protein